MKVGPAVQRLHGSELDLAGEYERIGERHPSEHDLYHQAHTFAAQCRLHAEKLEPVAERYGGDADGADEDDDGPGILDAVRRMTGAVAGRRPESGILLLRDLRELYVAAQETFVTWVIVNQGAQAARDRELLGLVNECLPETELQVKWLLTRIKVTAPQVLTS